VLREETKIVEYWAARTATWRNREIKRRHHLEFAVRQADRLHRDGTETGLVIFIV
jgi:hypothetical protein